MKPATRIYNVGCGVWNFDGRPSISGAAAERFNFRATQSCANMSGLSEHQEGALVRARAGGKKQHPEIFSIAINPKSSPSSWIVRHRNDTEDMLNRMSQRYTFHSEV